MAKLVRLLPDQTDVEKEALAWPGVFSWTKTTRIADASGEPILFYFSFLLR